MQVFRPTYFDTFRCAAGSCPDSCCQQWAVVVDEDAAHRYQSLPGPLGDRLRQVMCREDGDWILRLEPDGRCPMWREDGLCRIQAQLGEEALCHTCDAFPRLRHDYGSFVELGLELSCPVAARLILDDRECQVLCQQLPDGEDPEYDPQAMEILLGSRKQVLQLLSDTAIPLPDALRILLLYGYHVQEELDGGEEAHFDPEALLSTARKLAQPGSMEAITEFFSTLEILTDAWPQRLSHPNPAPWEETHRAMARYFVQRYWLQAVSDLDLVSRVKLTVVSCLLVRHLGGDVYETAQKYSKEIENDADNVDALLDAAYTEPALADTRLLWLLQNT